MRNGKWGFGSFILATVVALTGGTWAAKGYVDDRILDHRHSDVAAREEIKEMNKKLDDIRDRLGRIEGRLQK